LPVLHSALLFYADLAKKSPALTLEKAGDGLDNELLVL